MKRVVAVMVMLVLGVALLAPRWVGTVSAAVTKAKVAAGGGTAVVFVSSGEIFDLTLNGWKPAHLTPPGVNAAEIAVVLSADRIVMKDGTGWVYTNGAWKSYASPVR